MVNQNSNATDNAVNDLIQALNSRVIVYSNASDLADNKEAISLFKNYAAQSEEFASELFRFANHTPSTSDDVPGAEFLHGWNELSATTMSKDTKGIYAWCETREDTFLRTFEKVCNLGLPQEVQPIVNRHYLALKEAHGHVKALRDA